VHTLLDSGAEDFLVTLNTLRVGRIDPFDFLLPNTIKVYEQADMSEISQKVYYLDTSVLNDANEPVTGWQNEDVAVSDDPSIEPLSGFHVFSKAYTATNPGSVHQYG
jgi:hypothetical protein